LRRDTEGIAGIRENSRIAKFEYGVILSVRVEKEVSMDMDEETSDGKKELPNSGVPVIVGGVLTTKEAVKKMLDSQKSILGPDITIKQLIEAGRRV
jgi:hypothetical protein